MDKKQLISFIEEQVVEGNISREDLVAIAAASSVPSMADVSAVGGSRSSSSLVNVLYVIGAIIVLVGVVILVYQNWVGIGFAGRVLVTLGISAVTYCAGLLLRKSSDTVTLVRTSAPTGVLSQVMFTISAVLAPLGVYVLFQHAAMPFSALWQTFTALALFIIFAIAQYVSRKNILILILIAFGTWAYYSFIIHIFSMVPSGASGDWLRAATLVLGFSYLLIGYGYKELIRHDLDRKQKVKVSRALYGLATLAVLGAAISFGTGLWDLILIALIFAAFYGSVYLKSRTMLVLAALFLIIHTIRLTAKYFPNSIGWAASLIICGFLVIAVAYLTLYINRKFFK